MRTKRLKLPARVKAYRLSPEDEEVLTRVYELVNTDPYRELVEYLKYSGWTEDRLGDLVNSDVAGLVAIPPEWCKLQNAWRDMERGVPVKR